MKRGLTVVTVLLVVGMVATSGLNGLQLVLICAAVAAGVGLLALLVAEERAAPVDNDAPPSRLDRMDGVDR